MPPPCEQRTVFSFRLFSFIPLPLSATFCSDRPLASRFFPGLLYATFESSSVFFSPCPQPPPQYLVCAKIDVHFFPPHETLSLPPEQPWRIFLTPSKRFSLCSRILYCLVYSLSFALHFSFFFASLIPPNLRLFLLPQLNPPYFILVGFPPKWFLFFFYALLRYFFPTRFSS